MSGDGVWLDGRSLHYGLVGAYLTKDTAAAIAPYLADRLGAPPIPCTYHGQIDGRDVWQVMGGTKPGQAGTLDRSEWELRLPYGNNWKAAGTDPDLAYLARRRQPPTVSVTVDIPADATDEQIAAAVRAQMGGES